MKSREAKQGFGTERRLSDLSVPRQALVRMCQSINFGQIQELHVAEGEPLFKPTPVLLLDIKLDGAVARPEINRVDFALSSEICNLLDRLDRMESGRFICIEVRAGIPRRVLVEANITEAVR